MVLVAFGAIILWEPCVMQMILLWLLAPRLVPFVKCLAHAPPLLLSHSLPFNYKTQLIILHGSYLHPSSLFQQSQT